MNMMFLGIIMRIVIISLYDNIIILESMAKSSGHGDCGGLDDGGNDNGSDHDMGHDVDGHQEDHLEHDVFGIIMRFAIISW